VKPNLVSGRFWGELVRLAIASLFVAQIGLAAPWIVNLISPLIQNPNWSYDQKMRSRWGEYYDLMSFLQQHTSADAVILLPPRPNANMDPYFLYPRKLIYGDESALQEHPEIDYIAIDGEFPQFAVDGEKVMSNGQYGLYRLRR
jgi:hypothetical protein